LSFVTDNIPGGNTTGADLPFLGIVGITAVTSGGAKMAAYPLVL